MPAISENAACEGAKPALVLLHGDSPGLDADSDWAGVCSRLSDEFCCLAPDLLGFGTQIAGSPGVKGPRAWAMARAEQVLDILDSHDLERAHLVGNSAAGGAAALALLTVAPDRIERVVVTGGAGTGPLPASIPFYDDPTEKSMPATLGRLVAGEGVHDALVDDLADILVWQALRPGAEAAFRSMFADVAGGPHPLDLAKIVSPVLAMHGGCDQVVPSAVSERLVNVLPDARLEVVEGAGHWIHADRPDEFCSRVAEFLSA